VDYGGLSAVLDNAPTYLMFFANALGRTGLSIEEPAAVQEFLARGKAETAAISMGAVLFGAATYIGNSPQFHDQGNRRATQNAHAEFCWLRHKVFPSHPPAGAFADLLADVAWLKV
jgi:Putative citrate transport